MLSKHSTTQSGRAFRGEGTRLIRPRTVTGDGEGLVSHAGLVWLGEVADRSGLTAGFSQVLASAPRRRHDPGVTLVQLAIVSTVPVTLKKQGRPALVRPDDPVRCLLHTRRAAAHAGQCRQHGSRRDPDHRLGTELSPA